jgi:hypothetical protein
VNHSIRSPLERGGFSSGAIQAKIP